MAMYKKQLRSIADLEKEKRRISKKLEKLKSEDFLPSLKSGADFSMPDLDFLAGVIPEKYSIVTKFLPQVVAVAKQAFANRKSEKLASENVSGSEGKRKGAGKVKKVAGSILMEVLTGYLKWKAIELSIKGARHLIRQRRQKKAATDVGAKL